MSSGMEQMASNLSLSSFAKAKDLKKRIWFTLGALLVYRLGTFIPMPGIDSDILTSFIKGGGTGSGLLSMLNTFSGGALGRASVFSIGIMPYISSSIIIQLLSSAIPHLEALRKEGENGRRKLNQYTRYLTVLLAFVQGYGIAFGMESMKDQMGNYAVLMPGMYFRLIATMVVVGGVLLLMWLGEQITSRGVGNGISLLIFASIISGLPSVMAGILDMGRSGSLQTWHVILIFAMSIALIVFIVFVERAQRRVAIHYPKRHVGNQMVPGQAAHLPIKINVSNVIPPIFASAVMSLPMTVASFVVKGEGGWLHDISTMMVRGKPLYFAVFSILVVFFAFFYTSIVFNSTETADNLKKNGSVVPGYKPGDETARYFDYILTRITFVGSIYLVFICVGPDLLSSKMPTSAIFFGGTSLLIAVNVAMDTITQIHSYLLAHQYEKLMKRSEDMKGKTKGKLGGGGPRIKLK